MKKFAIHCETEELAKQVLQIAHDAGLTWSSGDKLLEKNLKGINGGVDICFCYSDARDGMTWCTDSLAMHYGYTIVKSQDFIEADKRHQESILETATV